MQKTHKMKGKPYKVPKSATFKGKKGNPHLTHGGGSKKTK